jgi:FkbM family methyltransferase
MLGRVRSRIGARRYAQRSGLKLIDAFAEAHPAASFVEIGANDGESEDLLRGHIRGGRWTGVMVEPVPHIFERLRANYDGVAGVTLENCAIADREGLMPFFHLRPSDEPGLPDWYDLIGSFSRENVLSHRDEIPDIEERIVETQVTTLTFDALCEKHSIDRVDLILVDTEGYDAEILKRIDLAAHRPRLVIYEHYHLGEAVQADLLSAFARAGYETLEEHFETFCLRTEDDELSRRFRRMRPRLPALRADARP